MIFRLGIDDMVRKEKNIYVYKNRQIQGCEVNECLRLESTKPKSMLNQVKSVSSDFLDKPVCVCPLCVEPLTLFSCEYTLNGSHSAHINHTFGANMALSR